MISLRHIIKITGAVHPKMVVTTIGVGRTPIRSLSSQGTAAVEKLRNALEEYRQENYTNECRSRFTKDIVRAAKENATDETIKLSGMQRVLSNIHMEDKVTESEMEIIFREMGGPNGSITTDRMMKLF